MLWSCPLVQSFWSAIHENIKLILKLSIPFCPSLFVLGDPLPLKALPSAQAEWVHTSLMLGRKLIVSEWKKTTLPPVRVWFSHLGIVAAHEGLSYRLINQVERYHAKWGNYISFIKGPWHFCRPDIELLLLKQLFVSLTICHWTFFLIILFL